MDIEGMIGAISTSNVLSAQHSLTRNLVELSNVMTRLNTGKRINSGKDDPAGLISSEKLASELKALEAETNSLRRADANANISEGHGAQVSGLMSDLNGLVVASANTTGMSQAEIDANQMQIDDTVASIERITGDAVSSLGGFNMPDNGNADVEALYNGALADLSSLTSGGANSLASGNFAAAQAVVEGAGLDVAVARGKVGAFQKYTIESSINSKNVAQENLAESYSMIVDTDYAVETSNRTRFEILAQASLQTLKIAQNEGHRVLDLFNRP